MSLSSTYKPSPLGYGSSPTARSSPFRRAETPASPSPLRYFTVTPNGSPSKADVEAEAEAEAAGSQAKDDASTKTGTRTGINTGISTSTSTGTRRDSYGTAPQTARPTTPTPFGQPTPDSKKGGADSIYSNNNNNNNNNNNKMVTSPRRPSSSGRGTSSKSLGGGNALSQLQPAQVRTLRDGFQILDRDCDGVVTKEDVADMLNQLGLPSGSTDVGLFFPPSKPQTLTLAAFLNSLAETLAILSPSSELMSAFSTFDDDDSGQVDWAELKEALLSTPPEAGQRALSAAEVDKVVEGFTGRRAFNRNMNAHMAARRGEVFKYQEFVNSLMGANGGSSGGGSHQGSEDQ